MSHKTWFHLGLQSLGLSLPHIRGVSKLLLFPVIKSTYEIVESQQDLEILIRMTELCTRTQYEEKLDFSHAAPFIKVKSNISLFALLGRKHIATFVSNVEILQTHVIHSSLSPSFPAPLPTSIPVLLISYISLSRLQFYHFYVLILFGFHYLTQTLQ